MWLQFRRQRKKASDIYEFWEGVAGKRESASEANLQSAEKSSSRGGG
jgi:hypothetical protein